MAPGLRIASALALTSASAGGVAVAGGPLLHESLARLALAQPLLLGLAALCFLAAPAAAGAGWTAAVRRSGARLAFADGCGRYAAGSLVNSVAPARLGDVVRLALFARALPARRCRGIACALVVLEPARVGALLAVGAGSVWPPAALLGAAIAAFAIVRVRAAGFTVAAVLLKTAGIALALAAFGDGEPLRHALLLIPALELAGLLPLTPGNAASVVLASSLVLHGALPLAVALHAIETIGGLSFGLAGSALLALRTVVRRSPDRSPLAETAALASFPAGGRPARRRLEPTEPAIPADGRTWAIGTRLRGARHAPEGLRRAGDPASGAIALP